VLVSDTESEPLSDEADEAEQPSVPDPARAQQRLDDLLADLRHEFPKFRIVRKDSSRLQRTLHYAMVIATFGRVRDYLDEYYNTVGATIYVTSEWPDKDPDDCYVLLRHEREHMRQFRRYTSVGMMLLYWLAPVPFGLAYFRARFEKAGYEQTVRASAEVYGLDYVKDASFREFVVEQFTTVNYGWMWPFRNGMEAWYDQIVDDIEQSGAYALEAEVGPLEEFSIEVPEIHL